MTMIDFTEEDWRIKICPCGHITCTDYFVVPRGPKVQGDGVDAEYARLIKAAPKLYLALRAARDHLSNTGYGHSVMHTDGTGPNLPKKLEDALAIVEGNDLETEAELRRD
jgi:hypothetical protein